LHSKSKIIFTKALFVAAYESVLIFNVNNSTIKK